MGGVDRGRTELVLLQFGECTLPGLSWFCDADPPPLSSAPPQPPWARTLQEFFGLHRRARPLRELQQEVEGVVFHCPCQSWGCRGQRASLSAEPQTPSVSLLPDQEAGDRSRCCLGKGPGFLKAAHSQESGWRKALGKGTPGTGSAGDGASSARRRAASPPCSCITGSPPPTFTTPNTPHSQHKGGGHSSELDQSKNPQAQGGDLGACGGNMLMGVTHRP